MHAARPPPAGVNILSTYIPDANSYVSESGTSMATPLVAGSALLIWSAKPAAKYGEIK